MGCEEISQRPYLHALPCSVIYHITHCVCSEDLASYTQPLIEAQVPPSAALFPPEIYTPWHEKNQQHSELKSDRAGDGGNVAKKGSVAYLTHCAVAPCHLPSQGAMFSTLQEFDTDFITIVRKWPELRQLWNALVLGEAAEGVLGRHDQHVCMGHFLIVRRTSLHPVRLSKT